MPEKKITRLPKTYMVNGNIVKVQRTYAPIGMDIIECLMIYYYQKSEEKNKRATIKQET